MTSVEPVFNVKHSLAPTFTRLGLEISTHFHKVTIPGSLLDQALKPPVSNIVQQPHGQSTCAGRHDYVSHGMLLPLELCGADTKRYAAGLDLSNSDIQDALGIAQWIFQAEGSRKNKVVLLAPTEWRGQWHRRGTEALKPVLVGLTSGILV